MAITNYTPRQSVYSKSSVGTSDVSCPTGVYKFAGCSILSCNATVGFNSTPSSMSVRVVEDRESGDVFNVNLTVPQIVAFSLPSGGINTPIIYPTGTTFSQSANRFYFAGILTNWQKDELNTDGKTATLNIVDPREVLNGVQCLLNSFSLSQTIGVGNRYTNVDNVIDVFGAFSDGYESERNLYGMPWYKIQNVLENIGVSINNMDFEFLFTGSAFNSTPVYYRIEDTMIDIVSLAQKVCQDGGSDLVVNGRKLSSTAMLVEFLAVPRTNFNPLTQTEISGFVSARADIVHSARIGREYRNEATSNIVVGGMRSANYVAYPTAYSSGIHLNSAGGSPYEDYNLFPAEVKPRLFGGSATIANNNIGSGVGTTSITMSQNIGAIFPFWGFNSPSGDDPMAEPFLPLDHLIFDKDSQTYESLSYRIPSCQIDTHFYQVRTVTHNNVFLTGDGNSDYRPFGVVTSYTLNQPPTTGKIKGLPLNTEVLRAALASEDMFYLAYNMYYPDIATSMNLPAPDWTGLTDAIFAMSRDGKKFDIKDLDPSKYIINGIDPNSQYYNQLSSIRDANGKLTKASAIALSNTMRASGLGPHYGIIDAFNTIIYEHVKKYADDYCGRQFVVCLPASPIMQRIWSNSPVPTRTDRPEIEYTVGDTGYWEYVPSEFDGVGKEGVSGVFTSAQEQQIIRRFGNIDGRFYPMVAMDWKPTGNASFHSNGLNKALFQDLPLDSFRPNTIASGNPGYIFISPQANQLPRRPDLAIVSIPHVEYDTSESLYGSFDTYTPPAGTGTEFTTSRGGFIKYLWYNYKRNPTLRLALYRGYLLNGGTGSWPTNKSLVDGYVSSVINNWADSLSCYANMAFDLDFASERVMDLKAVVIPLNSTVQRYGPWYATNSQAKGLVKIEIDESLVPWNFDRPPSASGWDTNLNTAGYEKLTRSLSIVDYLDSASIIVAGFPEYGLSSNLGFNSNITSISVDFGIGGITTTYNLGTYLYRPGTYRKSDYDNISRTQIDNRPRIVEPENESIYSDITTFGLFRNKFRD